MTPEELKQVMRRDAAFKHTMTQAEDDRRQLIALVLQLDHKLSLEYLARGRMKLWAQAWKRLCKVFYTA